MTEKYLKFIQLANVLRFHGVLIAVRQNIYLYF